MKRLRWLTAFPAPRRFFGRLRFTLLGGVIFGFSVHALAGSVGPVSGMPLEFGTILFGSTKVLLLTITNVGVAGRVTVATSINGPSYTILTNNQNTCLAGITAGQSCTLPVEFNPVAVGLHDDFLTLIPSGGAATSTVGLKGVASGVGVEMETALQFGTIPLGTTEVLLLTVSDIGSSGVVTLRTSINGPSYKILTSGQNTCLSGVSAGYSCTLPIEFSPVGVGLHDDILTVTPSEGMASRVRLDGSAGPASVPNPPVKGDIYVSDSGNKRVEIFDGNGVYLGQFDHGFDDPIGIAVNATNVYVKDGNNHCQIDKFDGVGNYVLQFGLCGGEGPGYLGGGGSLATDSAGNIWATDPGQGYLEKFDSNGAFLNILCTVAIASANIPSCPTITPFDVAAVSIALDTGDNIYVTNQNAPFVVKFDSIGRYLFSFGAAGSGDGKFGPGGINGIAVDSTGNIYVVDGGNNRVQVFDKNGSYLRKFGTFGVGNGQFNSPSALAIDVQGNLYVTDIGNSRIEKFDSTGVYLSQFGSRGTGNGQLNGPGGIAIAK